MVKVSAGEVAAGLVRLGLLMLAANNAYNIRMFAIRIYGNVIHEFDPWFNYRATDYLANHGWREFFTWFDHRSWYPLGRPVGTTIYPGMQIVSVAIWRFLNEWIGYEMSLNDVCVYVPVWFGVTATLLLALLTYECSGSANAATAAALIMAVIPAHLMRSVGGGYDNESVAMTAMCLTFYLWVRSVRNEKSWPLGVAAGLAYTYMVAAWGGFVFVLNMIGAHCAVLVLMGRYSTGLYRAYSLWYVVGTLGATRVPVVGLNPVRSLEQLAPGVLFLGLQLIEACEVGRRKFNLTRVQAWKLRVQAVLAAGFGVAFLVAYLFSVGYFGPISARVRGLFVKHTRTGNPLVDSVAEHQPASSNAYWHYLHYTVYAAPLGMTVVLLMVRTNAAFFVALYGCFAYFFSSKMVRLIIFLGPVASALAGVALGLAAEWTAPLLLDALSGGAAGNPKGSTADGSGSDSSTRQQAPSSEVGTSKGPMSESSKKAAAKKKTDDEIDQAAKAVEQTKRKKSKAPASLKDRQRDADQKKAASASNNDGGAVSEKQQPDSDVLSTVIAGVLKSIDAGTSGSQKAVGSVTSTFNEAGDTVLGAWRSPKLRVVRTVIAAAFLAAAVHYYKQFSDYAWSLAEGMSQPSIMFRAHLRDGTAVMVDDYREAYWWLRDHTPENARVMAWWDYGYQISGIANRTTIADGNTWNHEHIATLGRCLTSPEKQAHRIVRHLADYVLVWTGGGGDDLAKSPHMARIGNSVFRDMCPGDPTCSTFGFMDRHGTPTPMMAESLLYKLHSHNQRPGVKVDSNLFREVYTSRFNKVRIYKVLQVSKKSKAWVADVSNRICDAPGSWYCVGQYPPALKPLIDRRINFAQLEDFNKKTDAASSDYVKSYMDRMNGKAPSKADFQADRRSYFEVPWESEEDAAERAEKKARKKKLAEEKKKAKLAEEERASETQQQQQEEPSSEEEPPSSEQKTQAADPVVEEDDDDEEEDAFVEYDHEADAAAADRAAERAARARMAEWAEWSNSEDTTQMWAIISEDRIETLEQWISYAPAVVNMRSADGRGPLWWAHEYNRPDMVDLLVKHGADPAATDALGMTPQELAD